MPGILLNKKRRTDKCLSLIHGGSKHQNFKNWLITTGITPLKERYGVKKESITRGLMQLEY
jgi:hypothetical protein